MDFRASNGENIRATDLSSPKRNWSRTPMIVCLSEQEPHLWNWPKSRLDRNWYLFSLLSAKLRVVKRLRNYHSDGLMTLYEKYDLLCVYSDICHRFFLLHRAINYFIERFCYFLVCSVINAVIINAVNHQQVTKTLNNVIDSSMRHKMSVAYVRIYTQQSIFFHELSLDHQNYNFEAFSRLSMLLIADKTNTNSCQAWILVNFTNVAPAYSSIQYRQICSYHLIEETYSYPHVWKFPENMLKYLYGGTFEKCKLFWYALYTHWCISFIEICLSIIGIYPIYYNFYDRYRFRPNVLTDVSVRRLSTSLLGQHVDIPIGVAPCAFQRYAHKDAEKATAKGNSQQGHFFYL